MELTHINSKGEAVMVNVGEKEITHRTATAHGIIEMKQETLQKLLSADLKKGDGLAAARIAGIMGAKNTSSLIPLCHNIPIESVEIEFKPISETELEVTAFAKCSYKTGIEMEALTAVSVACLTVYDMCKAIDRSMVIKDIRLLKKTGGKSDYNYEG